MRQGKSAEPQANYRAFVGNLPFQTTEQELEDVFSAHGVSPMIREESQRRGLVTVDATCPLVTKVHAEAIRLARKGYQIVLIGHADHQEVIGTRGEAPEAIQVVECVEDIPSSRSTIRTRSPTSRRRRSRRMTHRPSSRH